MAPRGKPRPEPFSDSELERLREHAKEMEHRAWLRALARRWAVMILAIVGGVTTLWDAVHKLLSGR